MNSLQSNVLHWNPEVETCRQLRVNSSKKDSNQSNHNHYRRESSDDSQKSDTGYDSM